MADLKNFGVTINQGKYHEEVIYALALLYYHLTAAIENYLARYDLTSGKFNILLIVKHQGSEEGMSQIEMSKRLIVTRSNMTKMVDKLEKEKLVARVSLEGDRRVNIIRITKKGSDVLDKVWPGYENLLISLVEVLDDAEKKSLAKNLVSWVGKI